MAEKIGNLTEAEIEKLDWKLDGWDKAKVPPPGKTQLLYAEGQTFNPTPATSSDINQYIDIRNQTRPDEEQLPHV